VRRIRLVFLSALWAFPCAAAEPPAPSAIDAAETVRRIEAYVAPYVDAGHLSGTLLVARGGEVLFERAYGMADHELGVPNTPRTRHCVASITKPMTIAAVCQLAEEGKLAPDDPVGKWLPDFPRGDRITISHLLNHRAGIPHRVTSSEQESAFLSAADMVELAARADPLFEPGERSVYSSAGFAVLARIVEIVDGKPYADVVRDRVFRRAGMEHSVHPGFRALVPDRASSWVPTADGVLHAESKDLSFLVGAGSVFSTAGDLHRMMRALLAGELGQAARAALVRENGLRWNGITNGYRAFADYHADGAVEVIFTGNLHTGAVDRVRRDVPRIVAGEEVAVRVVPPVAAVHVDGSVLRRYEGRYEAEGGQSFSMRVRDGHLFAGDRLLVATSDRSFWSLQEYGRVDVVLDERGGVERLDWEWEGSFMPWRRTGPPED